MPNNASLVFALLALVAVALAFVASHADAAQTEEARAKQPTKPPTPRSNIEEFIYQLPTQSYSCAHNVTKLASFKTCADGSSPVNTKSVALNTPGKLKNWISLCGTLCIKANTAPDINSQTRCVGVVRRQANRCNIVECPIGVPVTPAEYVPKPQKASQYSRIAVQMAPKCFVALPTNRPTTAAPTRRPSFPTSPPIPACSVPGVYAAEFRSLEAADPRMYQFTEEKPNRKMCEMYRPHVMTSGVEIIENFGCTLEACIRWCAYADFCEHAMYSPVLKKCYRSNNVELTDDKRTFQEYYDAQWVTYRKHDKIPASRYWSGQCNDFIPSTCGKVDKDCRWNRGKRGYNDPLQGGSAGGYCGRIKCTAPGTG